VSKRQRQQHSRGDGNSTQAAADAEAETESDDGLGVALYAPSVQRSRLSGSSAAASTSAAAGAISRAQMVAGTSATVVALTAADGLQLLAPAATEAALAPLEDALLRGTRRRAAAAAVSLLEAVACAATRSGTCAETNEALDRVMASLLPVHESNAEAWAGLRAAVAAARAGCVPEPLCESPPAQQADPDGDASS
jgi:hypothetical protein